MCFCRIISQLYDQSEMSVYKLTRKFQFCLTDEITVRKMKNISCSFGVYEGERLVLKSFGEVSTHP